MTKHGHTRQDFHVLHGDVISQERQFEKLYRENYAAVYNYVYYRLLDHQATEDVVSEAFLRAARAFDQFDPSRAKFSTWTITIARNCMINYLRASHPVTYIGDDLASIDVQSKEDYYPALDEDAALCRQLLASLDDEDRELVFMKYYLGMRNTDIAKTLDMNASTVATKLQRALAKMHKSVS